MLGALVDPTLQSSVAVWLGSLYIYIFTISIMTLGFTIITVTIVIIISLIIVAAIAIMAIITFIILIFTIAIGPWRIMINQYLSNTIAIATLTI